MLSRISKWTSRVLALSLVAFALVPSIAAAGHSDPPPVTLEGAVCGFVSDLDELLFEFGQRVGDFDDDRLNRALDKAESHVIQAQASATIPDLTVAFRNMRAAMRELEKGAAVPVSGTGFADDLASLGSFFAQIFLADLISLSTELGAASAVTIAEATAHYQEGVADRVDAEWEAALMDFVRAVRALEQELVIGSPCSDAI